MDLPRYEPTFAAMAAMYRSHSWEAHGRWEPLSLSFVRTVATIAAGSGKGVLWGNDVIGALRAELFHVRDPRDAAGA